MGGNYLLPSLRKNGKKKFFSTSKKVNVSERMSRTQRKIGRRRFVVNFKTGGVKTFRGSSSNEVLRGIKGKEERGLGVGRKDELKRILK